MPSRRREGTRQYLFGANAINLIDLQTFIRNLGAASTSPAIKNACNAVLDDLDAVVVALHAVKSTSQHAGRHGNKLRQPFMGTAQLLH